MARLSLTFLGTFAVVLSDRPITAFRSAKVQGLLLYLALAQEKPVTRDVLAALFWPDEPDAVAKKNLRQSLYQLRRVLDEGESEEASFLLVTRTTIQFNVASDYSLDVTVFLSALEDNRPEEAVAVYGGDLAPGFTCDSLPFETWLREERERLHRQALAALSTLAARSLARADYGSAAALAQQQLAMEPWREVAHRQLMQALALRGDRSAALAQYEVCRAILEEELGASPAAETEALGARIRAQQLDARAKPTLTTRARRRLTTPFVGREREHDLLARAYSRAVGSGAQVVALLGEGGIGKTRLAESFLTWAGAQGADVLRGRAFETSARLSYHPLTQLLRQRLERENAPEDLLSDLWLTQLTRILPELRDRYPDLPEPTKETSTARQHLFEAITRLCQALARRAPLVIFVDDWHWADAASLDVLHYALLRWSEERNPILVLLTLRQEVVADDVDLQQWLSRLKHDVGCSEILLDALSQAETDEMVRTLFAPGGDGAAATEAGEDEQKLASFGHWLFREADGQPFFLVEMLRALADEGLVRAADDTGSWRVDWVRLHEETQGMDAYALPGVQELIRGWLERLSDSAKQVLTAASVLDQEATFDRLCRVAELDDMEGLAAIDQLLARQLVLEHEQPSAALGQDPTYRFSHQKLAELVYAEAGAARRRILHRRAFAVLQAGGVSSAELAHHAHRGGLAAEAIRYSIIAGNEAMSLLAVPVVVAHYETAWALIAQTGWPESMSGADRQDLYANLGRAYELVEAWGRAQTVYEAMVADAQAMGAASMECLGFNRLATVYINGYKEPEEANALLEKARAAAQASGDRRGLAETEWNLSLAARQQQRTHLARQHGEQALALARELGHPQLLARCLNSLSYAHGRLRQWAKTEAYAREARDLYAAAGNRILEADCLRVIGWAQLYLGRPQESLVTLQGTCAFSREIENLWGEAECGYRLAHTLLELGRYGEAIRLSRGAVGQSRAEGQPTMVLLALSTWGTVQRTLMALAPAKATLREVVVSFADIDLGEWAMTELCAVHAIEGAWDEAYRDAQEARQYREDGNSPPLGTTGWFETEALLRGGDGEQARAQVARMGKSIGGNRRFRLPWLRSRAVLARWDGNRAAAITHLQEALNLSEAIGLPGETWPILAELAQLYADGGEVARAREARQDAAAIILRLAETLDEEALRHGFLEAQPVRDLLDASEEA